MNALELKFRKEVTRVMSGLWQVTIHDESKLNPGVPDLSFVMNGDCETGWLELKQDESDSIEYHFHVEPGQHRWMESRAPLVPAYFLLDCGRIVFLLNGIHHRVLAGPVGLLFLDKHGIGFQREALRQNLFKHLTAITKRKQ